MLMIFNKLKGIYKRRKLSKLLLKLKAFGALNEINVDVQIVHPERVALGSYVYIGPGAQINGQGGVEIKSGTIIGPKLTIYSANHRFRDAEYIPYDQIYDFRKVIINENVWIGSNVIIAPGTEIGEGSVIGAGSVVSGKIPPLSIAVGNPCKVIKTRDEEHYYKLKSEEKIYLKYKKEGHIALNLTLGYEE
jgi:acetyltransferase-like isoleucine patch superfamily enzyme